MYVCKCWYVCLDARRWHIVPNTSSPSSTMHSAPGNDLADLINCSSTQNHSDPSQTRILPTNMHLLPWRQDCRCFNAIDRMQMSRISRQGHVLLRPRRPVEGTRDHLVCLSCESSPEVLLWTPAAKQSRQRGRQSGRKKRRRRRTTVRLLGLL